VSVVYRSATPDVEIPDVTLTEHVIGPAAARGEHPALIDAGTGKTTTYADLVAKVDAVAASLQGQGIEKGDVVALIGPNSAEWAIAYQRSFEPAGGHPDQPAPHPTRSASRWPIPRRSSRSTIPPRWWKRPIRRHARSGRGRPGGSRGPSVLERDHGNDEG
jgi:non-ribosomal peptide synthetase component F